MKILDFMLSQKTIFMASCNFTLNSVLKIDFYLKKNRTSFSDFFPTKCCNNNCNLMKAALIINIWKRKTEESISSLKTIQQNPKSNVFNHDKMSRCLVL